jgi:hypothetical protein
VETYPAYWQKHSGELADNYASFLSNFASLVTKEGEIVDNPVIRDLAQQLCKGVL